MQHQQDNAPRSKTLRRWLPLAAFAVLIALIAATGAYKVLSFGALVENYGALQSYIAENFWQAIALYALIYIVAVALSFPAAWVLTVSGGIFFGWWITGFATIISATLGAAILFWITSTSLGAQLRESAGPFVQKIRKNMQDDAINYMLFLRLVPAFPFTLVNIVPAILGVPFKIFFWTTLFGIAPGTFAYAYAGVGVASLVEAQAIAFTNCMTTVGSGCGFSLAPGDLVTPQLLIAFTALGLVSLMPIVIKRFRANNATN